MHFFHTDFYLINLYFDLMNNIMMGANNVYHYLYIGNIMIKEI